MTSRNQRNNKSSHPSTGANTITTSKSKPKNGYSMRLLGGFIGLIIGILADLIAAWIGHDLLQDAFTMPRLIFILAVIGAGLLVSAWLEVRTVRDVNEVGEPATASGVKLHGIHLWWSKLKTRGRGITISDVSSVRSKIDINSNDRE